MTKLKVNFLGGQLSFKGPVTNKTYLFDPSKVKDTVPGSDTVEVDEQDVPELLEKITHSGCGCGQDGKSFADNPREEKLFTRG